MKIFPEYESFDALGLASLVQRGVVSPAELLQAAIERVEIWNPKINAGLRLGAAPEQFVVTKTQSTHTSNCWN